LKTFLLNRLGLSAKCLAKKIYHKSILGKNGRHLAGSSKWKIPKGFGFSRKGRAHDSTARVVLGNIGPDGRKLGGECGNAYEYPGVGPLPLAPPP
jgi:hypothetical protein